MNDHTPRMVPCPICKGWGKVREESGNTRAPSAAAGETSRRVWLRQWREMKRQKRGAND